LTYYASSVEQLQNEVLEACGTHADWPARVAAGIYAALDFAAANPEAARALAVEARTEVAGAEYLRMVERFSEVFATEVPPERRLAGAMDQALINAIAMVVGDRLRTGSTDRLSELGPELVHLALLPYLGFDEAKRWAETTERVA
jgi:hypothetical protein